LSGISSLIALPSSAICGEWESREEDMRTQTCDLLMAMVTAREKELRRFDFNERRSRLTHQIAIKSTRASTRRPSRTHVHATTN
jgi:hypothetical protein